MLISPLLSIIPMPEPSWEEALKKIASWKKQYLEKFKDTNIPSTYSILAEKPQLWGKSRITSIMFKCFYKKDGQWLEETGLPPFLIIPPFVRRYRIDIRMDSLPKSIKEKIDAHDKNDKSVDITDEVNLELEQALATQKDKN